MTTGLHLHQRVQLCHSLCRSPSPRRSCLGAAASRRPVFQGVKREAFVGKEETVSGRRRRLPDCFTQLNNSVYLG